MSEKCKSLGGNIESKFGTSYCVIDDGSGEAMGVEDISCSLRPYPNKIDATREDLPKIARAMGEQYLSSFALCEDAWAKTEGRLPLGVPPDVLKTSRLFRDLSEHCTSLGIDAGTCEQIAATAAENPVSTPDTFWAKVEDGLVNGATFGVGMGLVTGAYLLIKNLFNGPKGGSGGSGGNNERIERLERVVVTLLAAAAEASKNAAPSAPPNASPQGHDIGAEVPLAIATVVAVEAAPSFFSAVGSTLWGGVTAVGEGALYLGEGAVNGAVFVGEGTAAVVGAAASSLIVIPESWFFAPPDADLSLNGQLGT